MIIKCNFDLTENKNGRRYSEECVKSMVEEFNRPRHGDRIGRFYTTSDAHEASDLMKFNLSQASHKFIVVEADGCKIDMVLNTLNMPHGDLLIELIKSGMSLTPLSIGNVKDGVVTEAKLLGVMLAEDPAIPTTCTVHE